MDVLHGDCLSHLWLMEDNSIDSLITDPPAGIAFMGKDWDSDKGGRDHWVSWMTEVMAECLRVLKPGAHGLIWALPRTSHWTATALENAGFEVRDVVTHLFGTGFPKSLDVSKAIDKAAGAEREIIGSKADYDKRYASPLTDIRGGNYCNGEKAKLDLSAITAPATKEAKQWEGWGTALKPASEHWILVRKPLGEKTVAANVLKHGVGGINIDACRVDLTGYVDPRYGRNIGGRETESKFSQVKHSMYCGSDKGRFPANLILDEEAAAMLDEQSGELRSGSLKPYRQHNREGTVYNKQSEIRNVTRDASEGGASRFFYIAKASKADRGEGNTHPTVKSTKLMSYLVKLITPPGGLVLDPFMGSGSTGVAAKAEGFEFVGIEQDEAYFQIAKSRVG